MPGMLTGAIIGMARALGETAPLLMVGMVAFIVDLPKTFNDAATVFASADISLGGRTGTGLCRKDCGGGGVPSFIPYHHESWRHSVTA